MHKRIVFVTIVILVAGLTSLVLVTRRAEMSKGLAVVVRPELMVTSLRSFDFSLVDQDQKPVTMSDFAGKFIVLEWTNYDCPFVRDHYEAGRMQAIAKKYMDQGVVWLAVNTTSYADVSRNKIWTQKHGVTYPVLDDSNGFIGRKFHAKATPHMYIFDKQGDLVYNGAVDNRPIGQEPTLYENYVDKVLGELIAGEDVSLESTKPYGCPVKYR